MSRMETELARAQEALAKAQQESEELRADLVRSGEKLAQSEAEKSRVKATVEEQMELTRGELDRASNVIGNIQYNVYQVKEINRLSHTAGIDKWGAAVEALVKSGFDIMTRPVDDPDDDGGAVPAQPNRR
ncbi:hypothetical protein GA0070564_11114 [Micromonospora mirobrigensis]|uniref:Uncharacterized protein n=2 Tax=Micromonospora mirobrigensis TaxID=262898 RepID=A0A1C5AIN1_9ACTN|nr:hypothetical protein GA0070564_11114 [Micromonospora mirobrigensis]